MWQHQIRREIYRLQTGIGTSQITGKGNKNRKKGASRADCDSAQNGVCVENLIMFFKSLSQIQIRRIFILLLGNLYSFGFHSNMAQIFLGNKANAQFNCMNMQ